ncbi:unnamed protein product [Ambrosiozyma monospora]|uniref:Unnamed protein product n=1 Tax=Ambrosiozyma monospora TaxID=43982 RepID=A0ACB5T132_AMBMO|nr:unnamed protein product [Ambrosiozyma monospora]
MNKKKQKQHQIIISKLYFLNRCLNNDNLVRSKDVSSLELLFSTAIAGAFEVLSNQIIDIDAYRLALGVLLSAMSVSFGESKKVIGNCDKLYLVFARVFAPLGSIYSKVLDYCRSHDMFKPKRVFTQLFPPEYPFEEYTIESTVVNDETVCEILLEFNAVLVLSAQISNFISELLSRIYILGESYPVSYAALDDILGDPSRHFFNPVNIVATTETMRSIIDPSYYPGYKWISFKALTIATCELYFESFVRVMLTHLPTLEHIERFPKKIFTDYIMTMLKAACSKAASIEHLSIIPRKGCFSITGHLRTRCISSLYSTWNDLGRPANEEEITRFGLERFSGFQRLLYSNEDYIMMSELLLVCMQRNEKCHEFGTKMFWSIIVSELVETQSLFNLESQVMGSLYDIFLHRRRYSPDIDEIKSFITSLKSNVVLDVEDEAYTTVTQFVNNLSEFLTTAAELKSIPEGDEFDDDRTFHKINISGYLMNAHKPELLESFINSMYVSHLDKKNYTQAALSLQLLADTYTWDVTSYLGACKAPPFPAQSEFKRKESLYRLMASNFTKGGKVEQAVECYKELLDAYDNYNFDLAGLSYCYGELSKAFAELQTVGRLDSTYFKISFIGYGFPASIRGKEFIYEGMAYEHITSINHRLNRLYPGSRIISNEEKAKELLTDSPIGKYLYIKTVAPQKCTDDINRLSFMSRQYIDNKHLNLFVSTRRIPGSTDFSNLWTEEVTYETFLTFPTLMNRSEIKTTAVVKVSPIMNAIKSLVSKNEELSSIDYSIKQDLREGIDAKSIAESPMFGNLSRVLAGTVDSPVNGGVGQYRYFFGTTSDEANYEENKTILRNCFNNLIISLNNLLKLHGALIPQVLQEQHKMLVELFKISDEKSS